MEILEILKANLKEVTLIVSTGSVFIHGFLFFISGFREQRKFAKELKVKKIEDLFVKLHSYEREARKYLGSIKVGNNTMDYSRESMRNAQEFLRQCEIYKLLYFPEFALDCEDQVNFLKDLGSQRKQSLQQLMRAKPEDRKSKEVEIRNLLVVQLSDELAQLFDWCIDEAKKTHKIKVAKKRKKSSKSKKEPPFTTPFDP